MLRINNLDEASHTPSVHCVTEASGSDLNKYRKGEANASQHFDNGCAIIAAGGNVGSDRA
jgi:hypothetical protein